MKKFKTTEDQRFDYLLRAHVGRKGGDGMACQGFDPDFASAYIEHGLTSVERTRYEHHLSECAACRKGVVALARMAEADTIASPAKAIETIAHPKAAYSWLASIKAFFSTLATPQVAAMAVAVIALAITIPLVLSRKDSGPTQTASSSAGPYDQSSQETQDRFSRPYGLQPAVELNQNAAGSRSQSTPRARQAEKTTGEDKAENKEVAFVFKKEAEQPAAPPTESRTEPEPAKTQKAEAKAEETKNQAADAVAGSAPAREQQKPLARIERDKALRLPQDTKDSAPRVSTLKPGQPGVGQQTEKEKTAVIRSKDSDAPATESSASVSRAARRIAEARPKEGARENNEAARSERAGERRIGGKRFYLLKEVWWTDKDYNPDKEMAVVPVVRDSDQYKELLVKRSGLKVYFMNFAEDEYAIVVYKGTVYKLIPRDNKK